MATPYETLMELASGRRSIRRFRSDPVPDELLLQVLEAARWAPTAGNRQAFRFLVVDAARQKAELAAAVESAIGPLRSGPRPDARDIGTSYLTNFTHFANAPTVIVVTYRVGVDALQASLAGEKPGMPARGEADALASVASAVTLLLLAAHAVGLGGCWMTSPLLAAEALSRVLGLPDGWAISALVPLGYPAETPAPPPRRPLARIYERLSDDAEPKE